MVAPVAGRPRHAGTDDDPGPEGRRLRLLDGFAFDQASGPVNLPHGAQRLLAFLAVEGGGHRDRVAGSLWPEVTDSQSHACLRTAIWRMNSVAPAVVRARGSTVDLDPGVHVDSHALRTVTVSLLRDPGSVPVDTIPLALLTAGDLLPTWDEEWVDLERERLRQLRLQALEVVVRLFLRTSRVDAALDLALEAVGADALRESARAALIRVHLAEGNVVEARRQFRIYQRLLRRELGIDPSPALSRLLPIPVSDPGGSRASAARPVPHRSLVTPR